MADHFGPIALKWDPKNLEIRTMSVEKTLEPLVLQVSVLLQHTPSEFWRKRTCRSFVINSQLPMLSVNLTAGYFIWWLSMSCHYGKHKRYKRLKMLCKNLNFRGSK
jgi:hypothetical protein